MDEGVSALIGRIYEGVHDPHAFDRSLTEILPLTGAQIGLVVATEVTPGPKVGIRVLGAARSGMNDALADYEAEGLWQNDPTYRHFMANPQARFFDTALHRDRESHLRDDYTGWNRHHVGGTHWMACHAPREGHDAFGVALHMLHPDAAFEPAQRTIFRLLFEHLDRAQWLATRPPDVSNATDAVLLIDPRHRVRAVSPAGEAVLAAADGLQVRDGVLATSGLHQQRQLDRLLQSALAAVARGGVGGEMLVDRPSGLRPLIVTVDPLPDRAALASFARGAMVRVVDPEAIAPPAAVARWRSLWHLTAAETRAAAALVAHEFDLRAAAEATGITYATIRTQLAAIYAKTRTGSQPELMRLLTRIPG